MLLKDGKTVSTICLITKALTNPVDYQVDAFVDHLDRNGNTVKSYTLRGFQRASFLIELTYDEQTAIEQFDVTFNYNTLKVIQLLNSYKGGVSSHLPKTNISSSIGDINRNYLDLVLQGQKNKRSLKKFYYNSSR